MHIISRKALRAFVRQHPDSRTALDTWFRIMKTNVDTEQQYDQALDTLHHLLDVVGDDETHPLYDLLDTLGVLIHTYEESHAPAGDVSGIDVLRLLMDEHQLTV